MARALKCDRCGGFFDYIKCLRRYQIRDMDEKNFDKSVDLCPDCYAKLLMFLDLDNPDKINKEDVIQMPLEVIANGTPLPKGHGRLIDADALRKEVSSWGMNDYEPSDFTDEIDRAPTIIEADKEK